MNMEHAEYLKLQNQLQDHFDGRYKQLLQCDGDRKNEANRIDELKEEFSRLREEFRVDRAKTNTRLSILIGILSAIAVPVVGVCVKMILG